MKNTSTHQGMLDDEFLVLFANCSLNPELFTHEAHLRLAWLHIHRHGLQTAIDNITTQIPKYAKHLGADDLYHHTVTMMALHIIDNCIQKQDIIEFQSFLATYPILMSDFKSVINAHYSFDVFSDTEAKVSFISPDKSNKQIPHSYYI